MLRTHTCGQLTSEHLNSEITLCGWVDTMRKLGGMTFVDLRDRHGITQIKFDPSHCQAQLTTMAEGLKNESVIQVKGRVIRRPDGMHNKDMKTWDIEIQPTELHIFSKAWELPFSINHENPVSEDLRLEYRYLDLRRQTMQSNIQARHRITMEIMRYFDSQGFCYIETPTFVKNTPEGSREYVVPVRTHPGQFFVLPQSPQQLKQLSMVAGMDRYFQIARCYRDEDLRGDRQPEFTQLDLEMSFVQQEDIIDLIEKHFTQMTKQLFPHKTLKSEPFARMSWQEAMDQWWSDKPELRTESMRLIDVTEIMKNSDFGVFKGADCTKAIVVPKLYTRSEIDNKLTPMMVQKGSKGVAYLMLDQWELKGSIAKFFTGELGQHLISKLGLQEGQTAFFQAGRWQETSELLWFLRNHLIKELNLTAGKEDEMAFAWVVDFPLYEYDHETGDFAATHHPFTKPKDEDIPFVLEVGNKILAGGTLSDEDKAKLAMLKADSYDIVCNGYEVWGGSIRIITPELQTAIFAILWLNQQQITERFGHLIKAFWYGVPPHGGLAYGLDRLVMLYQNMPNIREVIPYPKNGRGEDLMLHAPSSLEDGLLKDLGIKVVG